MIFLFFPLLFVAACQTATPLVRLQKELEKYPAYSVILHDMRAGGNFLSSYQHQYKVVVHANNEEIQQAVSKWQYVSKQFYRQHLGNLGMTLVAKNQDGEVNKTAQPAGYQYVGNSRYGQWVERDGTSFWEFYGKYALISGIFGMMSRPVYRADHRSYLDSRRRGQSFYGRKGEYGSNGSVTKKSHPSFFQRQRQREVTRKRAFGQRVRGRATRSHHSGFRRRSFGGFGK